MDPEIINKVGDKILRGLRDLKDPVTKEMLVEYVQSTDLPAQQAEKYVEACITDGLKYGILQQKQWRVVGKIFERVSSESEESEYDTVSEFSGSCDGRTRVQSFMTRPKKSFSDAKCSESVSDESCNNSGRTRVQSFMTTQKTKSKAKCSESKETFKTNKLRSRILSSMIAQKTKSKAKCSESESDENSKTNPFRSRILSSITAHKKLKGLKRPVPYVKRTRPSQSNGSELSLIDIESCEDCRKRLPRRQRRQPSTR